MDNNFEYTNSFVLYESVYKHFLRLSKNSEIATRYIKAIMDYGLYKITPEEDDEIWMYGLDADFAVINSAKNKYAKKICIPESLLREYVDEGLTQKQMAELCNCSVDTIQRRIKQYGL